MKQGRATHSGSGSTKIEPRSTAINPGAVSRIGSHPNPHSKSVPMYEGRGLQAPMAGTTVHKRGSQGSHK